MGIPTSEVGYTPAMSRREDHEVHKDVWWHWEKNNTLHKFVTPEQDGLCQVEMINFLPLE